MGETRRLQSGTRVLVVEHHEIFRAGLRTILEHLPLLVVVGEASNAAEAIAATRSTRPDCILLDADLGPGDAPSVIRQLRALSPRSAIVVLSAVGDPMRVMDAIGAGAAAYLLKDMPSEQLSVAIDRATSGDAFVDPALAGRVVQAMSEMSARAASPQYGHGRPEPLTAREREVLTAISRGRSNKEIAFDLHLAAGTVKIHVERILRKLTASNRVEATTRALQYGLIDVVDDAATATGSPSREA